MRTVLATVSDRPPRRAMLADKRLHDYAEALTGRSVGEAESSARATALLAHSVQIQANVPA